MTDVGGVGALQAWSWGSVCVAGVIYALLALDHIAVGQFMVSRPLVIGPLLGWYWGDPETGLLAGIIVEILWVQVIPVGHFPLDLTSMAAFSVTWGVTLGGGSRAGVVVAFLVAIPAAMVIRAVNVVFRREMSRFTPWVAGRLAAGQESAVSLSVSAGLVLWFVKGFLLFMAIAMAGRGLVYWVFMHGSPTLLLAFDFVGKILPLFAFGAILNYFFTRGKTPLPWKSQ